jgi:hypothetical protein
VANLLEVVRGQKYDGVFLHDKMKSLAHDTKIADTVTNIVVPSFDVKFLHPIIFSTYEGKADPLTNARLSHFPAHFFETHDDGKSSREYKYNLADNPTMIAMSMLTKEVLRRNPDFKPGQATEYRHYLIISIGTGSAKLAEKYTAPQLRQVGTHPVPIRRRLQPHHRHLPSCQRRHCRHPRRRALRGPPLPEELSPHSGALSASLASEDLFFNQDHKVCVPVNQKKIVRT